MIRNVVRADDQHSRVRRKSDEVPNVCTVAPGISQLVEFLQ